MHTNENDLVESHGPLPFAVLSSIQFISRAGKHLVFPLFLSFSFCFSLTLVKFDEQWLNSNKVKIPGTNRAKSIFSIGIDFGRS